MNEKNSDLKSIQKQLVEQARLQTKLSDAFEKQKDVLKSLDKHLDEDRKKSKKYKMECRKQVNS